MEISSSGRGLELYFPLVRIYAREPSTYTVGDLHPFPTYPAIMHAVIIQLMYGDDLMINEAAVDGSSLSKYSFKYYPVMMAWATPILVRGGS